jgi:hypothetical protein
VAIYRVVLADGNGKPWKRAEVCRKCAAWKQTTNGLVGAPVTLGSLVNGG